MKEAEQLKGYTNLFKALPVEERSGTFSITHIDRGVLIEDSLESTYSAAELDKLVDSLVPQDSDLTKTFHKSWEKIRDASIEQLVAEQLTHYFTTYGLECYGLFDNETVFIPNERLQLEGKGGITFFVLRGITATEAAARVHQLINSGIALSDDDLSSLIEVIEHQNMFIDPVECANRELRVRLCSMLKLVPKDPVEYLRLQVYSATDSSLLIKSEDTIEKLSSLNKNVFEAYEREFGLAGLASIFYRFKPLFLALKNPTSAPTVNRIRRLAKRHHQPMPEDYIANVTKHLRDGTLELDRLERVLAKTNPFRKLKLLQALGFYRTASEDVPKEARVSVVYSIRNGKSFATTTASLPSDTAAVTKCVWASLAADMQHLAGKNVYMDAELAVPTSGKMFVGDVPMGSFFETDSSLVLGVSWSNVGRRRIDLDLSLVSVSAKVGWDASLRNNNFLFSGDVTAAPNGATEAHLVRQAAQDGTFLLNLNFYNGGVGVDVPFDVFVTKEDEYRRMSKNAMMSQDNMLFWARSVIDSKHRQKTIGVLRIRGGVKRFHLFESKSGLGISARCDGKSADALGYYERYLETQLMLRELLDQVGAVCVDDASQADIDLSLKSLTKDGLVQLLVPSK